MKVVVYTAILGNIDYLWSVMPGSQNVKHVAFVDKPKQEVGLWGGTPPQILGGSAKRKGFSTWEQRVVDASWSFRRTARHYKTLPHRYLPDADIWIWIDGNVRLRQHPNRIVRDVKGVKDAKDLSSLDGLIASFKHPDRNCAYEEGRFCSKFRKDNREIIAEQLGKYRRQGFPPKWGLAETRVVIRSNTKAVRELGEAWWSEIEHHSLRDQVSLPYVCWLLGIRWKVLSGGCNPVNVDKRFYYAKHA